MVTMESNQHGDTTESVQGCLVDLFGLLSIDLDRRNAPRGRLQGVKRSTDDSGYRETTRGGTPVMARQKEASTGCAPKRWIHRTCWHTASNNARSTFNFRILRHGSEQTYIWRTKKKTDSPLWKPPVEPSGHSVRWQPQLKALIVPLGSHIAVSFLIFAEKERNHSWCYVLTWGLLLWVSMSNKAAAILLTWLNH